MYNFLYHRFTRTLILLTSLLLVVSFSLWAKQSTKYADIIYTGKHIITMDEQQPSAEAVAVKGDRIIAVGDKKSVYKLKGKNTDVVELGNRALLPGFIDAHGHLLFQALLTAQINLSSPPVGKVKTIADLKQTLKDYIQRNEIPEGQWVLGYGYDESLLTDKRHPRKNDLDEVSTKHPIYLTHVSGHLAAVNSTALERHSINADTPDPDGGSYRRYADSNEPNGVMEETAAFEFRQSLPLPSLKQSITNIINAQQYSASNGLTTLQDGAADAKVIQLLQLASEQSDFLVDVVAYQLMQKLDDELPAIDDNQHYHRRFRIGGVKLVLDGSPQGKTAFLTSPYEIAPHGHNDDYRGYPIYANNIAEPMIEKVLKNNIPLLAHANGDAAADILINAVDKSKQRYKLDNMRTTMIHAQTVRDDQLDNMAKLGMIPSFFSTHTFFWGDWHRDSVLGVERAYRISPTESARQRSIVYTVHNDSPIVPPDMIRLLWSTTNRRTRSGDIIGPQQRVSTYEALKAMTINAAYQYFEEDSKGSITTNKQADFVILSENPLLMTKEDLLQLNVEQTIAKGKTIYKR